MPLVEDVSRGWMFSPEVAPDGRRVAVYRNLESNEKYGIWVIFPEDGSEIQVFAGAAFPVAWSADGAWIYANTFGPGQGRILKVPATGGDSQVVFEWPHEGRLDRCAAHAGTSRFLCSVVHTSSDIWMVERFDPDLS